MWFALAATLGVALVAWVIITMQQLSHDLRTANEARDALARQVQLLGHKPVAGPPGSRGATGSSVIGPAGPPGPSGASGEPGKDAPTLTPSPGPTGPAGPSGAPGADSTVPGPTGPAGQDGASGKDGSNGSPPAEWTYTDQAGNTYDCTPADNFDPDHPRYKCVQTSTATPTPSPSSSPQPGQGDSPSGVLPSELLDSGSS
jgi:hypothetical protein